MTHGGQESIIPCPRRVAAMLKDVYDGDIDEFFFQSMVDGSPWNPNIPGAIHFMLTITSMFASPGFPSIQMAVNRVGRVLACLVRDNDFTNIFHGLAVLLFGSFATKTVS